MYLKGYKKSHACRGDFPALGGSDAPSKGKVAATRREVKRLVVVGHVLPTG